jgi:hypothetical protein
MHAKYKEWEHLAPFLNKTGLDSPEVATTPGTRRQIPRSGNPHQVLASSGEDLRSRCALDLWACALRIHQSPTAGNPLAALDSPQCATLGTTN